MFVTFHAVTFSWIFFRANDVTDALTVILRIAGAPWNEAFVPPPRSMVVEVGVLVAAEWLGRGRPHALHIEGWSRPVRWAAYYALVAAIMLRAALDYTPFIYFQF